jgi:hypothetical protein
LAPAANPIDDNFRPIAAQPLADVVHWLRKQTAPATVDKQRKEQRMTSMNPVGKQQVNKQIFLLHGLFLALAGSVQLLLEGVGHFGQLGPYATIFGNSPYTIGFVEAHGLALLIGLVLWRAGRMGPTVQDARLGMAVALLLGGANLLFWPSFVTFQMIAPGVVATLLHLAFLAGYLRWLYHHKNG